MVDLAVFGGREVAPVGVVGWPERLVGLSVVNHGQPVRRVLPQLLRESLVELSQAGRGHHYERVVLSLGPAQGGAFLPPKDALGLVQGFVEQVGLLARGGCAPTVLVLGCLPVSESSKARAARWWSRTQPLLVHYLGQGFLSLDGLALELFDAQGRLRASGQEEIARRVHQRLGELG